MLRCWFSPPLRWLQEGPADQKQRTYLARASSCAVGSAAPQAGSRGWREPCLGALTLPLRGRLGGTLPQPWNEEAQPWNEEAERHTLHSCVTTRRKVQSCTPLCGVLPAYPPLSPDMVSVWPRTPEWRVKSLSGGLSVAGERGRGGRSSRRGGDLKGSSSIPSLRVAASFAPLLPRPWH